MSQPRRLVLSAVLATTFVVLGAMGSAAILADDLPLSAPPIQLIGGVELHPPWRFFEWRLLHDAVASERRSAADALFAFSVVAAVLAAIAMRPKTPPTVHGSARWATRKDAAAAGLLAKGGVVLGAMEGRYLRHDGPEHVMCVAPTRSGKGVGLVIPTLLSWTGSALILDVKRENWRATAGWRARFSDCICFDPTSEKSARFNPLMEVRRGEQEVRDAQTIADILVDPDGALERRSHWDKTAHALLTGAILHVLYAETEKTLAGVAALLSDANHPIEETLQRMIDAPHLGDRPHSVVAQAARELLDKAPNERSGVVSTALSCLSLYRDPIVARATSACDWRIEDLKGRERPVSLYLATPPSDLSRVRSLMRLILNQTMRRLTEEHSDQRSGEAHQLLLMLDEFPALGRLDFFESALGFLAGYGVRSFLIAQSLSQLQKAYGPNSSILDNCHVRIFFAPNDERTAKRISDLLGAATVAHEHRSRSGSSALLADRVSVSDHLTGRPLLTPGEVMALPAHEAILFAASTPPLRAHKIRFYEIPELRQRATELPDGSAQIAAKAHDWQGRACAPVEARSASEIRDAEFSPVRRKAPAEAQPDAGLFGRRGDQR